MDEGKNSAADEKSSLSDDVITSLNQTNCEILGNDIFNNGV